MFQFVLSMDLCFTNSGILICAVMEGMWLLDATMDSGYRAKLLEGNPRKLKPLITRTPKENWMIHPEWVQRLTRLLCFLYYYAKLYCYVFLYYCAKLDSFIYAG